jgi:predicted permease
MFWLRLIYTRLYGLLRKDRVEQEMEEEMRFHLRMRVQENIERGMRPDEADREARQRFGNVGHIKDLGRDIKGGGLMETILQDLRYGARMLAKNPGFTLTALVTLALGIGANTAIFSVVDAVLLRPLPFIKEPDRLVMIHETKFPELHDAAVTPGNFLDWKRQNTVFERLIAYTYTSFNLVGTGDPEQLSGMKVTDGFFATLGAQPLLGRDFLPEEDQPGRNNVVILSYGLWKRRFAGDSKILNQTITLSGESYTVIGVMPASIQFGGAMGLWTPMAFTARQSRDHDSHNLPAIGRLKPGVTLDQARTEMIAIAGRLAVQYKNTGWSVKLIPLHEYVVRNIKPALFVLLGAVAFVLLIACANVANLLLARAAGRQKEIAIRSALGASRARIICQLLTESLLLALAGGAVGLLLAKLGMGLLLKLAPQGLPRMGGVPLNGRVLAFTAAITLLTAMISGLVPALQYSKPNLNEMMKDAGRSSTKGGRRLLVRNALVVLEVASALVLLVGAGLLIKSFWQMRKVDPGFNPDNALTISVALPRSKYADNNQQVAFFQQLIEKVGALPSVQAAGVTSSLPLGGGDNMVGFEIQGRPRGVGQNTNLYSVSAEYFKAMGIPLLRGRLFTESDTGDSPRVVVINETIAKRIIPDEDPVGKRIKFDTGEINEIVGIVGDVKQYGLDQATPMQTYYPHTQQPRSSMTLVIRTVGDPTSFTAAVRNAVLQLDKEQPISNIRTLAQRLSTSNAPRQFYLVVLGIFAAVAMLLAAGGIYGVLCYAVTQRTHEIGIRMALGAGQGDVLKLVVGHGMLLTLLGMAAGLAAAFALTRWMKTLLFEVKPTDPLTFSSIALLLLAVALLACWIPARRATKVDPLIALKHE